MHHIDEYSYVDGIEVYLVYVLYVIMVGVMAEASYMY